ncbi:MAG: AAA family ATPase [Candidatus Saccharimonadales bacterium]
MQDISLPFLIIVRGIPGSGKSRITDGLVQALASYPVVVLDPDAINYDSAAYRRHVVTQLAEGVQPALHAYRYLRAQAYEAIDAHQVIIWSQPFTNLEIFNKMIERLRVRAKERAVELPILVVEVQIDQALAKQRVVERLQAGGHGPSSGTLQVRFNEYESFHDKGYNTVAVQGTDDVAVSVQAVLNKLK